MGQIEIKSMTLGMVATNCYLIINKENKEALLVDPADNALRISNVIEENGCTLKAILLTHGHFDHIMGIDTLRREWSVPVYASALEQKVLTDANVNLSVAYGAGYVFADAKFLEDGASLALAGYQIRMICPVSCCGIIICPNYSTVCYCYYRSSTWCREVNSVVECATT